MQFKEEQINVLNDKINPSIKIRKIINLSLIYQMCEKFVIIRRI